MQSVAEISHLPITERRIAERIDATRDLSVVVEGATLPARSVNVSVTGLLVESDAALTIWSDVTLDLPGVGRREARVVRRDEQRYGLVLREPLTAAEFAAFTGLTVAEEPPAAPPAEAPPRRVTPMAFGRDRVKTFQRLASAPRKAVGQL